MSNHITVITGAKGKARDSVVHDEVAGRDHTILGSSSCADQVRQARGTVVVVDDYEGFTVRRHVPVMASEDLRPASERQADIDFNLGRVRAHRELVKLVNDPTQTILVATSDISKLPFAKKSGIRVVSC